MDTLNLAGGADWGVPSPYLNVSRGPGQAKMRLVFASLLEKDETGDVPWLVLVEAQKNRRPGLRFEPDVFMEDEGGRPSAQLQKIYREGM